MNSGRLQTLVCLGYVLGASLTYEPPRFEVRIAAGNLTNENTSLPNSPDVTGELIVIPAPERNFRTSVTLKFLGASRATRTGRRLRLTSDMVRCCASPWLETRSSPTHRLQRVAMVGERARRASECTTDSP